MIAEQDIVGDEDAMAHACDHKELKHNFAKTLKTCARNTQHAAKNALQTHCAANLKHTRLRTS
jgi:hypothetical protein